SKIQRDNLRPRLPRLIRKGCGQLRRSRVLASSEQVLRPLNLPVPKLPLSVRALLAESRRKLRLRTLHDSPVQRVLLSLRNPRTFDNRTHELPRVGSGPAHFSDPRNVSTGRQHTLHERIHLEWPVPPNVQPQQLLDIVAKRCEHFRLADMPQRIVEIGPELLRYMGPIHHFERSRERQL